MTDRVISSKVCQQRLTTLLVDNTHYTKQIKLYRLIIDIHADCF